jgi:acylphosphatase
VAEGSREQVDTFIRAVQQGPRSSRVDECRVEDEIPSGEFKGFEIRSSR